MGRYGLLIGLLLLLGSCHTKPGMTGKSEPVQTDSIAVKVQDKFPFPAIPELLTSPGERRDYLLTHYWEQFDFADTTLVNNRDVTEQGFVNFIALLADGTSQEDLIRKSLENWCRRFVSSEYASLKLMDMADSYLYNPNSPFYNEYLYEIYLESLTKEFPEEDLRISRYNFILKLLKRNNPGSQATDFTYYLSDGSQRKLSATPVKNNRLLLLFYDPECESCHEVLLQMASDATLAEAVRNGKLSVLAVYTEGNDEAWRKALPDMPKGWIVGTDREAIKLGALYDLKAMPSLYLLDGNKRVVLKDASYERIVRSISVR